MAAPLLQLTQPRSSLMLLREIATAWQGSAATVPSAPPVRPLGRVGSTASVEATGFVGRDRAMVELRRLLDERRLVTLTGPSGVGKTRLARRLVAECGPGFAMVWSVDLAPWTETTLLPAVLASAGMAQTANRPPLDLLSEAIGRRRVLLLLDRCEHLIDACAGLAGDLLAACPGLRILATSRDPLVAPGELAWPVPPLSGDAARLFLDRAATARPGFVPLGDDAEFVDAICRQLDGLPLAIELAATRVRDLSLRQIAAQLNDRQHSLARGERASGARRRALRTTLAWSDGLLAPPERALLRSLSVFPGDFSAAAADSLAAPEPSSGALDRLVEAGLVSVEQVGVERRYRLPDAVRVFALERLRAESPELEASARQAHVACFRQLAEEVAPLLRGPSRGEILDRLAAEAGNLRAALVASMDDSMAAGEDGLRLAAALWWFWFHRGDWTEGRAWLDRALAGVGDGAALADGPALARATALCGAGWLAFVQDDVATARRRLAESVAAFRQRRDGRGVALAAGFLSQALLTDGDLADARRLAGEAVALARGAGSDWDLALARINLGNVEGVRGNDLAAGRLFEEGVVAARAAGDRWLEAMGLRNLAIVAARTGKSARGVALLRECLALSYRTGERWFVTRGLEDLATLAAVDGDPARAACLLGAADSLGATAGATVPSARRSNESAARAVRRALPAQAVAGHWATGRAMTLAEAVAFALDEPASQPVDAAAPIAPPLEARPAQATVPGPVVLRARGGEAMQRHLEVPTLRIAALGAGCVELGGRSLSAADWTYAKPRELLFFLLDHADRTKEQVGAALWPDASAEQLRGSFHVALHHLRRVLGEAGWVRYADRRYAVSRDRAIVYDVARFEECLTVARDAGADRERAIAALDEAVALYAGDYLEDHAGAWIETRRDGLRRAYLDALLLLGETRLTIGRPLEADATFRRLLADDELHEAGHRGLIRALARQDQPGQALRHFESLVDLLRAERAAAPAPETSALATALRAGEAI